jgi:hypothetical protein
MIVSSPNFNKALSLPIRELFPPERIMPEISLYNITRSFKNLNP